MSLPCRESVMAELDTKIPETLEEAIAAIKAWEGVDEWKAAESVCEAVDKIHHFGGRVIRNAWGLWTGSPLAVHLYRRFGLVHADDMSGLILHCAWQELNDLNWDAEAVVDRYNAHWKKNGGRPEMEWVTKLDSES